MGCLTQHHRIGCRYKSKVSWLFEGCRTSCPGWPSMAADSSLAGWQAKTYIFFPLVCARAFGFPICRWKPVTGKMRPEGVLGLGALFHVSRPLWACWGPLVFSLTPPAQCSGCPSATMAFASPLLKNPSHWESSSVTWRAHAQAWLFASQCRAPQARLCFATWVRPQWPWELK